MTYINDNGETVYTGQYLRNKGTCCRTTCLHCPYGHTLKVHGLTFRNLEQNDLDEAKKMIPADQEKSFDVTASLLGSAFGGPKNQTIIGIENLHEFQFVLLKGQICGLIKFGHLQVKELYLKEHFKDQGLEQDVVNSYFIES